MSKRNINPNQFKLFYGGKELRDSIASSGDVRPTESMDEMWKRKVEESKAHGSTGEHGSGVYDSMSSEGYKGMPLTVRHEDWFDEHNPNLGDGHHRVATAAHIEETTGKNVWIPVENYSYTHSKLNSGARPPVPREKLPPSFMLPKKTAPKKGNPLNTGERKAIDSLVRQILNG